jgi:hypothetical protein
VPYESVTLVRAGKAARGALVLHAAAGAPGGATSPVSAQRAPVETGADAAAALAGSSFTYTASLRVRAGTQVLSLALTDEASRRTSYVQATVVIGPRP